MSQRNAQYVPFYSHSFRNLDTQKVENLHKDSQREAAQSEPSRLQSRVSLGKDVERSVEPAELLRQFERILTQDIWRPLGLGSRHRVRQAEDLKNERPLLRRMQYRAFRRSTVQR